eukprot:scaffold217_cov377-Prasinococcus_capsulatus_cf.AAC.27
MYKVSPSPEFLWAWERVVTDRYFEIPYFGNLRSGATALLAGWLGFVVAADDGDRKAHLSRPAERSGFQRIPSKSSSGSGRHSLALG